MFLPGEDPAEFEAHLAELHAQFQPRNELEAELLKRLARDWWFANRAQNAAMARLEYRIHHQAHEEARALEQQVTRLGRYLLKDVFRPAGSLRSEKEGGARIPRFWSSSSKPRSPAAIGCSRSSTACGSAFELSELGRRKTALRSSGCWASIGASSSATIASRRCCLIAGAWPRSRRTRPRPSAAPRPTRRPRSRRRGPLDPYQPLRLRAGQAEAPARDPTSRDSYQPEAPARDPTSPTK